LCRICISKIEIDDLTIFYGLRNKIQLNYFEYTLIDVNSTIMTLIRRLYRREFLSRGQLTQWTSNRLGCGDGFGIFFVVYVDMEVNTMGLPRRLLAVNTDDGELHVDERGWKDRQ